MTQSQMSNVRKNPFELEVSMRRKNRSRPKKYAKVLNATINIHSFVISYLDLSGVQGIQVVEESELRKSIELEEPTEQPSTIPQ